MQFLRLWLVAGMLVLAACSKPAAPSAPAEKRYPLTGEILSVDQATNTLQIAGVDRATFRADG